MTTTTSPVRRSETVTLTEVQVDAADAHPPSPLPRLRKWMPLLRDFFIRVLNYLTNYIVAYLPSFTLRRLWYRRVLGIALGQRASVFMGTYMWFYGPGQLRREGARIGRNTRINRRCTLDFRTGLRIGDNVSISPEVMILGGTHDHNAPGFAPVAAPVTIEDHVFVGTRAMILPGVTLGRGAVVVAGSLVSKDVPPMTIVAGVPARAIGLRDEGGTAYELNEPIPLFE